MLEAHDSYQAEKVEYDEEHRKADGFPDRDQRKWTYDNVTQIKEDWLREDVYALIEKPTYIDWSTMGYPGETHVEVYYGDYVHRAPRTGQSGNREIRIEYVRGDDLKWRVVSVKFQFLIGE